MFFSDTPNIIVVGGNAAGPAAAAKAKRTNPKANVILFEAGEFISTGTCELPYVLSREIEDYNDIVFFTPEKFLQEKGVEVYNFHKVESINKRAKTIRVTDLKSNSEKEYDYDKLILATGSKAKQHPEISADLENVFTLKSVSDLLQILDYLKSNSVKNATIFGAGYIGLELSEALKKLEIDVTLLDNKELPMSEAEPEIQDEIEELLQENDVSFNGKSNKLNFYQDGNRLSKIKVDGYLRSFDIVLITIGVEPNIALAKNAGLDIGKLGGIKIDNRCKTSDPHIYAAGDCVEVINSITKRPVYLPIATLAHQQGHVAGENAAGKFKKLNPSTKNIAVKIFDKVYTSVGLTEKEAYDIYRNVKSIDVKVPNLVKVMPNSSKVFAKIIFDEYTRLVLGASFFGGNEVVGYADIVSTMIYNKNKIDSLAEVNFNYTPPLSPFINVLSVLGRKIKRG